MQSQPTDCRTDFSEARTALWRGICACIRCSVDEAIDISGSWGGVVRFLSPFALPSQILSRDRSNEGSEGSALLLSPRRHVPRYRTFFHTLHDRDALPLCGVSVPRRYQLLRVSLRTAWKNRKNPPLLWPFGTATAPSVAGSLQAVHLSYAVSQNSPHNT